MSGEPGSHEEQPILHPSLDSVPFAKLLGLTLVEVKRGSASLSLEIREELKQNNGVVHGGVIASLIDTAAAFALSSLLRGGETITTVDLTIHYLEPLTHGHAIAFARVLRAGKRVAILSIQVSDDDDRTVATAVATFLKSTIQPL